MRFPLWTILKTINTKPQKGKDGSAFSKVKSGVFLASALMFLSVSFYSFNRAQDADGMLFLALTLYCAAGAFLHRRLFRRDAVAAAYGTVLALAVGFAALRCSNGVIMAMWALFFPAIAINIFGIKVGGLLGGLLAVYFAILFYTPVFRMTAAAYPAQIRFFYPVLYGAVYATVCAGGYLWHKQLLNRQKNEETLERAVRAEHDHVMIMTTQTILSISNAVDARDAYTQRHSARVAEYTVMLAKALGWDSQRLERLYSIALLHDIGKIGISDSILNKHDTLSPEEREIIKQHTVIGGDILKDLTLLPNASVGAVSHHERYDGTGYPYGLKGKQIPLEARIIGIADAFDAMNSTRVYRARLAPKTIMQRLRDERGRQFDPELLDIFLPIAEQILQADEG